MTAIVTGLGAGAERGSGNVLGGAGLLGSGTLGRSGEQVLLNAATGNLMIQQRDEMLIGRGPDAAITRTYNSQGDLSDDNGDNWRQSTDRRVYGLTGTINTSGSTVKRVSGDGSEISYTWNATAAAYVATDGAGAYDKLEYNSSNGSWKWTDGDSQATEIFAQYGVYGLTGTVKTVGSTISRRATDGSTSTYTWDNTNQRYIVGSGTASADNLTYGTATGWTWSNSGTAVRQFADSYRITDLTDTTSNTLHFTYATGASEGQLDKVTTADGGYVKYIYDAANGHPERIKSILTTYTDFATSTVKTLTRTTYGYDLVNRLTSVTVDLTPENATDSKTYVTTYGYDGTSKRVALISQTDGSSLAITYDANLRVSSLTQAVATGATRITTITYDTTARTATVVDPYQQSTTLAYDVHGNLTKITAPAAATGGARQVVQFAYNGNDDVVSTTDAAGSATTFGSFTTFGNAQTITDREGHPTLRTFGAKNELLTETVTGADPSGDAVSLTTRYVYNSLNQLAFIISPDGNVYQQSYDGVGQHIRTQLFGKPFDFGTMTSSQAPSKTDMNNWIAALTGADQTAIDIEAIEYDLRGNATNIRKYQTTLGSSNPSSTDPFNLVLYAHDQAGQLLSRNDYQHTAETFVYDGLGRVVASVDMQGGATSILFDDALTRTIVTLANGLTQTSTYNKAGDLLTYTEGGPIGAATNLVPDLSNTAQWTPVGLTPSSATAIGVVPATRYTVVSASSGQALVSASQTVAAGDTLTFEITLQAGSTTSDLLGFLGSPGGWGEASDTTATIVSGDGTLEISFGGVWKVSGLTASPTRVRITRTFASDGTAQAYLFVNSSSGYATNDSTIVAAQTVFRTPAVKSTYTYDALGRVRAMTDATGHHSYIVYDNAGRKVADVDDYLTLTEYKYDADNRVIATVRYANRLSSVAYATTLAAGTFGLAATSRPAANATADLWTFKVYDKEGRTVEAIDGTGDATEYKYDASGKLTNTIGYANKLSATQIAGLKAAVRGDNLAPDLTNTSQWTVGGLTVSGNRYTVTNGGAGGEGLSVAGIAVAAGESLSFEISVTGVLTSSTIASAVFGFLGSSSGWGDGTDTTATVLSGPGSVNPFDRAIKQITSLDTTTATRIRITRTFATAETVSGYFCVDSTNSAATVTGHAVILTAPSITRSPSTVLTRPTADSARDRVSRIFYDKSGRVVGTLDGEGYLSRLTYDGTGRLVAETAFATVVPGVHQASASFSTLVTDVTTVPAPDRTTRYVYDNQGLLTFTIDPLNHVTEFVYRGISSADVIGMPRRTIQYAGTIASLLTYSVTSVRDAITSAISSATIVSSDNRSAWAIYDVHENLAYAIDASGAVTGYKYDAMGHVTKTTRYAALRPTTALPNDSDMDGWASAYANPANDRVTRDYYDARGDLIFAIDSEGFVTRLDYDAESRLVGTVRWNAAVSATDSTTLAGVAALAGGTYVATATSYDNDGRIASTTDGTGSVTTYVYNANGTLGSTYRAYGTADQVKTSFDYDAAGRVTARYDAVGISGEQTLTQYSYNAFGEIASVIDPGNNASYTYYDRLGRAAFHRDAESYVTETRYTAFGEVASTTVRANRSTSTDYSIVPVTTADTARDQTTYAYYDALGRVKATRDAANRVTETGYNTFGEIASIVRRFKTGTGSVDAAPSVAADTRDATTSYAYGYDSNASDAYSFQVTTTDAENGVRVEHFNAFGELGQRSVSVSGSSSVITNLAYYRTGLLKSLTVDPAGKAIVTSYVYDALGRQKTVIDATSKSTGFEYDGNGRLTKTTDALNNSTYYTYDARGNLVAVRDAADKITRYIYDHLDRRIATVDALGGVTTNAYDANGNVIETRGYITPVDTISLPLHASMSALTLSSQPAADHITRYAYDKDGRMIYAVDGLMHVVEYRYDAAGNVVRTTRYDGTITPTTDFSKDGIEGRIAVLGLAGKSGTRIDRSVYDSVNQLTFDIDALGQVTQFTYDALGNMVKKTEFTGATYTATDDPAISTVATWSASATGERTTRAFYDRDGRLTFSVDAENFVTRTEYDQRGQVSKQTRFAGAYTSISNETTMEHLATAYPAASAADRVTQFNYDSAGRLIETIDPENFSTRLVLDQMGRITSSTAAYGNAAASPTTFVYDDAGRVTSTTRGYGTSDATTTAYTYDALDRVTYTTVAFGTVDAVTTKFDYDALGRVTTQTRGYGAANAAVTATSYDAFGRIRTVTDARSSVVSNVYDVIDELRSQTQELGSDTGDDLVTSFTYDNFGNAAKTVDARGNASYAYFDKLDRATRQVDGEKYVTDTAYTRGGEVESVKRWARRLTVGVSESTRPNDPETDTTYDATTSFDYDKRDLLKKTTDALGYYEEYTLNAFGERKDVRNKLGATSNYTFDRRGLVTSETLPVASSNSAVLIKNSYEYDARGNRTRMVEADGAPEARVTTYEYSRIDQLITTAHQPVIVFYEGVGITAGPVTPVETVVYDRRGNVIATTDAAGATTWMVYDTLDRKIAQIDPLGAVQTWAYDANGNVTSMRAYPTLARLPAAAGTTELQVRRMYDLALGRQPTEVEIVDWSYHLTVVYPGPNALLTAFGSIIGDSGVQARFPNAASPAAFIQAVYHYAFQREATGEEVTIWVGTMAGGWTRPQVLEYFSEYDNHIPLNLKGMIAQQALAVSNTTGYRETTYAYDRADRLTTTTVASLLSGVWNGSSYATTTGSVVTTLEYDKNGNVTHQVDARGNSIYTWYDKLGRKTAQVDAENYLTTWTLDAEGNALSETRYAAAVGAVSSSTDPASLTRPWFSTADDRVTVFTYDRLGRRLTEQRLNVDSQSIAANGAIATGAYLGGNVELTSQAAQIMRMYDVMFGRPAYADEIAGWTVYLNAHQNDAQPAAEDWGNRAAAFPGINMKALEAMATGVLANAGVQIRLGGPTDAEFIAQLYRTAFRRDATAQEISDWTLSLANGWTRGGMLASFSEWVDHRPLVDVGVKAGAIQNSRATSTISYSYNGLGEVLSKIEANGDTTGYTYDSIGRLTLETGQAFTDYLGSAVTPRTAYTYDGLNNLTATRVQVDASGTNANDRVTNYHYGVGGRLEWMTDATGFRHDYGYDATGRTVLDLYGRMKSDGSGVAEAIVYRYDAAGRMIMQTNVRLGSVWTFSDENNVAYDAVWMRYDAYGHLTGRGVTAGSGVGAAYQEVFDYDAGGRLWHSNSGDGVERYYVYDKAGNQTLTLTSTGANLSGLSVAGVTGSLTGSGDTNIAGAVTTITQYDRRGQAVATYAPDRELTAIGGATVTLSTARAYTAFGEVKAETEARGFTTNFAYNTMGRMTAKMSPQVSVTAENGAVTTINPTDAYGYDLSGRLVAVTDAGSHVTTRLLLAGTGHGDAEAQVTKEFHADGGVVETKYDVFGDARAYINELSFTTFSDYDRLGRLITVTHPQRAAFTPGNESGAAQQLVDEYRYDGLGQRIRHWNSQFISTYVETTDYDAKGRVTATANFAGDAMTYGYSAFTSGIATSGMGTFGGWTRTTTNGAASRSMTDKLDYFGRTVDTVDYGGHDYDLVFDKGGRLTGRSNDAGESIGFSWYNSGLAAGQTGTQGTAGYTYDANGNRLTESLTKGTTPYRTASATYDALGRMTHWEDQAAALGGSSGTPVKTDWKYDAVGNVRRATSYYAEIGSTGGIGAVVTTPKDNWYTYDSMNRVLIDQGQFNTATSAIERGTSGTTLTWNLDGTRATATTTTTGLVLQYYKVTPHGAGTNFNNWFYLDADSDQLEEYQLSPESYILTAFSTAPYDAETRESYSYTADGQLAGVSTARQSKTAYGQSIIWANGGALGTATPTTQIGRDALGRITHYLELGNGSFERTAIVYDRANRELTETSITYRADGGSRTNLTNTYTGGVLTRQQQQNYKGDDTGTAADAAAPDTDQSYTYSWWDGAIQSGISYDSDTGSSSNALWTTDYSFDKSGHLTAATIRDGQWRDVGFVTDQNGMVIDRTEDKVSGHNTTSMGSPRGLHYMFAGQQMGTASNNGTDNTSYTTSIRNRLAVPPASPSPFAPGATASYDFDQNYDAINGTSVGSTGGSYTAQGGETLASVAQSVWGDASLWYLLADANGLSGSAELNAGQTITIPNKVINRHNTSDTFRPYDPNEALDDTSPTDAAKPPKAKSNKCGSFGVILLLVVAVAVTAIVTAGVGALATGASFSNSLSALAGGTLGTLGATATTAGLGTLGAIGAGVAGAVVGSIVSQGLGLLTGIQDKFSWKSVALAGLTAAVSGGIGAIGQGGKGAAAALEGAAKSATGSVAATTVNSTLGAIGSGAAQAAGKAGLIGHALTGALRSAAINATTQGIATATGLQDKFDWGAVASSAVGGGLANSGTHLPGGQVVNSVAARIAGVGASSLVTGTDFGDNLMHALPDIIGQTIGDLITQRIARGLAPHSHGDSSGYELSVHQQSQPGSAGATAAGLSIDDVDWSLPSFNFGPRGIASMVQTVPTRRDGTPLKLLKQGDDIDLPGWSLGYGKTPYIPMGAAPDFLQQQNNVGQSGFLQLYSLDGKTPAIKSRWREYEGGFLERQITTGDSTYYYYGGPAMLSGTNILVNFGDLRAPEGYYPKPEATLTFGQEMADEIGGPPGWLADLGTELVFTEAQNANPTMFDSNPQYQQALGDARERNTQRFINVAGKVQRSVTDLAVSVIGANVPFASLAPGVRAARARTDARIVNVGKSTVNSVVASGRNVIEGEAMMFDAAVLGRSGGGRGLVKFLRGGAELALLKGVGRPLEALTASSIAGRAGIAAEGMAPEFKLFENLRPGDPISTPKLIDLGTLKNISVRRGVYVVDGDGQLLVSSGRKWGHIDLAGGRPVQAAGEFRTVNGQLRFLDNNSGHYRPGGASAQYAAETAWQNAGFDITGKYVVKYGK